jgi:predicted AlkP superfamily phosphohydrolase/phosphomutase
MESGAKSRRSGGRILLIGLDGFDIRLAERFVDKGLMPNLARFGARSARYGLDHGRDKYSGLTWEHFSTGRSPSDGGRWSAITFDPATYGAKQDPTSKPPVLADLSARTVVFDVPYCDLAPAAKVRGLTSWGAHDPGVAPASRPDGLHEELNRRFGPYPATESIYGFCWPSALKTRVLGDALAHAVEVRAQAARWLLVERLPDWDLGIVVVSESHSAIEPLWHGVDALHPLHGIDSAAAAAEGICKVYVAIDRLIGDLHRACSDATLVVFAAHGMGANEADVAAMALLPKLLYRAAFAEPYMVPVSWPSQLTDGTPLLGEDDNWEWVMQQPVPFPAPSDSSESVVQESNVSWMPAWRYCAFWPKMLAFALPSFYDGRVRINVQGREAKGIVPREHYLAACEQVASLLQGCRNLLTGEPAIAEVIRPKHDPNEVGGSEADLYVIWRAAPLGLRCPTLGTIGPLPYRRTGGHTGERGFLYIAGEGIRAGERGHASTFDVVPTLLDLLGEARLPGISGSSLKPAVRFAQAGSLRGETPAIPD